MIVVSAGVELKTSSMAAHYVQPTEPPVAGAMYGNNRGPVEFKDKSCIFGNNKDVLYTMDVEETLFLEGAKIFFDAVVLVLFFITLRLALISCYVTK